MKTDVDAPTDLSTLRAVAEPIRWRIVELLSREQLCVCHFTAELGIPQPLVSHHLRVLREAGLVESERFRYWTYYRLRSDALGALGERIAALSGSRPQGRRPCC